MKAAPGLPPRWRAVCRGLRARAPHLAVLPDAPAMPLLRAWGAAACVCLFGAAAAEAVRAAPLAQAPAWARVSDDRGHLVVLERAPQRIVSLLPSLTEAVCVLDACHMLVGVDRWSNWPASVAQLPRLGGLDDVQVERVLALKPDLVLMTPSQRLSQRLRGLGLQVAELDAADLAGVKRTLRTVGRLLGREAAAEAVWARMQQQLQAVAQRVPARVRGAKVYVEVSSGPHAASASSYIGELLAMMGLNNIVPGSLGPYPKLNPEHVLRAEPAWVVVSAQEAPGLAQRPGWSALPAVQRGQVCALARQDSDVLARPGPRLPQAAEALLNCFSQGAK